MWISLDITKLRKVKAKIHHTTMVIWIMNTFEYKCNFYI